MKFSEKEHWQLDVTSVSTWSRQLKNYLTKSVLCSFNFYKPELETETEYHDILSENKYVINIGKRQLIKQNSFSVLFQVISKNT